MTKIDWPKWSAFAEILGAFAIVVTLVYLAVQTKQVAEQTKQNNLLLAQQAQFGAFQARAQWGALGANEEFSRLIYGDTTTLDELGRIRRHQLLGILLSAWEWEWLQSNSELFGDLEIGIAGLRHQWQITNLGQDWNVLKNGYSPDFAEFIDENIVDSAYQR